MTTLSKLHTYNRPTTGLAWARERKTKMKPSERIMKRAEESRAPYNYTGRVTDAILEFLDAHAHLFETRPVEDEGEVLRVTDNVGREWKIVPQYGHPGLVHAFTDNDSDGAYFGRGESTECLPGEVLRMVAVVEAGWHGRRPEGRALSTDSFDASRPVDAAGGESARELMAKHDLSMPSEERQSRNIEDWLPRADEPIERVGEYEDDMKRGAELGASPDCDECGGTGEHSGPEGGDLRLCDCTKRAPEQSSPVDKDSLTAEVALDDIRETVGQMQRRLEQGQGKRSDPMCRLPLSMSKRLLEIVESERARHAEELERERARVRELEAELSEEREIAPYGDAIAGKEAEELRAGIDARDSLAYLTKQDKRISELQSEVTRLTAELSKRRAEAPPRTLLPWRPATEEPPSDGMYLLRSANDATMLHLWVSDRVSWDTVYRGSGVTHICGPLPVALPESGEETK